MLRFLIHRPKWIVVLAGLAFFWLARSEWCSGSHLWQKAEGVLMDHRYLVRGPQPPHPDIQIIGLGGGSFKLDTLAPEEIAASPVLQKMLRPWPWDRSVYAAILEKLAGAGAKVVVFDFVFASEQDGDVELAKAIQKYQDRVVVGALVAEEEGVVGHTQKLTGPNERLLLPGAESVVGLVTIWPDNDNVIRRVRYRTSVEREAAENSKIAPPIAGPLQEQITQGKIPDNLVHLSALAAEKFKGGKVVTPPPDQKAFINYQGPKGTYRAWPVENMFVEELWKKPPFRGGLAVSNKIVMVGPMAEIFHDVHTTPMGEMPGPEIQAQILGALLNGEWLSETGAAANFWLAIGSVAMALLICLGIPQALLKGVALAGATAALLAGCQAAFSFYDVMVPMMPPLFCLVATGAFGIIFEYTLEQLDKRRYRNVLDRYVSKNVAKTILSDRRSFVNSLKGRKRPVTVLFSDIRGFTTMTEKSDADKLVAQLNEYFAGMVGSVLHNEGTLQKFIGDAIMAVWGDTHTSGAAADARKAVTTAIQMRAALEVLNAKWADDPDRSRFSIGVGVNHGEVIVGNIGHPQRMEFTVLGDGVNLAARLESATKQFHTDILVGEEVERLTREQFIYRTVDLLKVKGKTRPVEVFSVLGERPGPVPAWLAIYQEGISLYRARNFSGAAARFSVARHHAGGRDFLCDMYFSRCEAFGLNPPPADWDGSYTLSEK